MEKHNHDDRVFFGFWIYLMTDLLMFAVLFATFMVLRDSNFGAITMREIFNPPFVLVETLILLTSSLTCGLGVLYLQRKEKNIALTLLSITALLGLAFVCMEVYEFRELLIEGNTPQRSSFLSAFFSLVGLHGLHISIGFTWLVIMIYQLYKKGLTHSNIRKSIMAGIFWHFLDVVWIFIFTIVYLFGGIL